MSKKEKKFDINYKKILSLLVSGSLSFSLMGCRALGSNYIPMDEMFYDENDEGLDDVFESKITDSDVKIDNICRLERSILLIRQLLLIDYKDVIPPVMGFDYENVTDEDIDKIEEELFDYLSLKCSKNGDSQEQKSELLAKKRLLYERLILLINYVKYRGSYDLYQFGRGLYSSVILDTLGYDGNEKNVAAVVSDIIGIGNVSSYSYGDIFKVLKIPYDSQMYDLVFETLRYEGNMKLPSDYQSSYTYVDSDKKELLKLLDQFDDTIQVYKESMVTQYKVKEHRKCFFDIISCDYDIECGEPDKEMIKKK